jgi:hypothetical protein
MLHSFKGGMYTFEFFVIEIDVEGLVGGDFYDIEVIVEFLDHQSFVEEGMVKLSKFSFFFFLL